MRRAGALARLLCLLAGSAAGAAGSGADRVGKTIYLRGLLGSGAPLEGVREEGVVTTGADAACVNCHQRSGLGSVEGRLWFPPITTDYLYSADNGTEAPLAYVEGARGSREPYTKATLARAIREGLDSQGRPFSYLMPRFALSDQDMEALLGYLEKLSVHHTPGVTDSVLSFATIVAPDADPVKRRAMLEVLEQFVSEKNKFPFKPTPKMRTSARTQYAKSMYMANRRWRLFVWELTGPPAGWRAQLDRYLVNQPVYAVLSGLAGSTWAPVHEFCEQREVPCLFPNVEVPVVAERDFYPLYFSKGVLLEAELIAKSILGAGAGGGPLGVVEQVYRAGGSGERAAEALSAQLRGQGLAVHGTVLPAGAKEQAVKAALRKLAAKGKDQDALVLWLGAADLTTLAEVPPGPGPVYLSGLLGGLELAPLPAAWRERARMTYPVDLPEKRRTRLNYPLGWFSFRRIPVVAEQLQTDTYLACTLLAEVLNHMADNFDRPYLIEQLQGLVDHRLITGYYPRLSLASNQRFASKGGYLVQFKEPTGKVVTPVGDWTVP